MTIAAGDKLPDATFKVRTPEGLKDVTTAGTDGRQEGRPVRGAGRVHPDLPRPAYAELSREPRRAQGQGCRQVACVAVNDAFVLDAWGKAAGADGKILLLSDGNATFTKAIGLDFDGSGFGLGTRSKRYAMVVDRWRGQVDQCRGKPRRDGDFRRRQASWRRSDRHRRVAEAPS